jgi:ATP-dependent Lhr-like helicase
MYEGDAPLAERRAQALSLDSALLAELLGQAELRELIDADAMDEVEAEVQRLAPERRAKDLEGVADLLRMLGDLTTDEVVARGGEPAWLVELEGQRRALRVRIAGQERWVAVEDAGRLRDALGAALPVGVAEAFLEPVKDPVGDLVSRYARTHGPFHPADVAARFGMGIAVVDGALARLATSGRVVHGEFRPGGTGSSGATPRCSAHCAAGRWPSSARRSSRSRRTRWPASCRSGRASAPAADAAWTRSSRRRAAAGRHRPRLGARDAGPAVPGRRLLPRPARRADRLRRGAVGRPGRAARQRRLGVPAAGRQRDLLLPEPLELSSTPLHDRVLEALDGGQALFFRQLSERVGNPDDADLVRTIWDLVWAGAVTNDTLTPLRARLGAGRPAFRRVPPRPARLGRRPAAAGRLGAPAGAGRWSLLPSRASDDTRRMHALADVLLDRHGIVTRGAVQAERVRGGFAAVYTVLKAMEEAGRCRRGYFVESLGAAQFAMPGAVDRMRALATDRPASDEPPVGALSFPGARPRTAPPSRALVLAATDPANPYGGALPWPERPEPADGGKGHRPGRKAEALVVLVGGALVLYVERGGKSLLSWSEEPTLLQPAVDALALAVRDGSLGTLAVERADGQFVLSTALGEALETAGFRPTPRGLRLRA